MPESIASSVIYIAGSDLTADTTDIDPTITVRSGGSHEPSIDFTLAGSGSSDWFETGTTETVVVATGTAKFYCANSDKSVVRELTMSGQVQTATATKCGIVCQDAMPPFLRVTDTSGSSNPCTIYFKRRNSGINRQD